MASTQTQEAVNVAPLTAVEAAVDVKPGLSV